MVKKNIPIVMAANDAYVPYLGVSIQSMCNHFSSEANYHIFILQQEISDYHKRKIKCYKKDNISINFIDISSAFSKFNITTVGHLSKEAAYRLVIDKLFPEYDKILYIDSDTIILKDLAELYAYDIGDAILGAVRARLVKGLHEYIENDLKISSEGYFNSGVLVINILSFRDNMIGDKGLYLLETGKFLCQDQDVLNLLCQDKVFYLDGRWNVEWQHLTGLGGLPVIDDSRKGTLEMVDEPYIIHYTSRIKPWMRPDIQLADCFWDEARKSIFYEEILYQNLETKDLFCVYLFPWSKVEPNSKVVLYGYGNVGRVLYEQIKRTKYCEIIAVCDKRADEITNLTVSVIHPEDLKFWNYDKILIGVEQKKVADVIRKELLALGIEDDAIKWGESDQ